MDKLIKLRLVFCVIFVFLFLEGCKSIEHVFLENNTHESIIVKVTLLTKNGEQIMETRIAPNASDGWSYEVDNIEKNEIDKKLRSLIIANERGCKKELNRNEIIEIVEKTGSWKLDINPDIMNCN